MAPQYIAPCLDADKGLHCFQGITNKPGRYLTSGIWFFNDKLIYYILEYQFAKTKG